MLSLIVSSNAEVGSFEHSSLAEASQLIAPLDTPDIDLPFDFQDQSNGDPLNYPNSGGFKLHLILVIKCCFGVSCLS